MSSFLAMTKVQIATGDGEYRKCLIKGSNSSCIASLRLAVSCTACICFTGASRTDPHILPTYNLQLLVGLQQRVPPRVQQRSPLTFLVLHENSHFLVELLPTHRSVLMRAPGHFLAQLDKRLRFPLQGSLCAPTIHASACTRGQANKVARSKRKPASVPRRSGLRRDRDQSTSIRVFRRVPTCRGECCNAP